jgi:ADP-ribose pyrophosphatase YjhB (NUDIX family)
LREAAEETGLEGLTIVSSLGVADYDVRPGRNEVHRRHFFQLRVEGPVGSTWDHAETTGGSGGPRPFRFSWTPLEQGHSLVAGFGAMLSRVDESFSSVLPNFARAIPGVSTVGKRTGVTVERQHGRGRRA